IAAALVHVDDEPPRRAGLVVVVLDRERGRQSPEIHAVGMALGDLPGEDAEADAVGRATSRLPAHRPAGADRVAVARLEVVARDVPAHGSTDYAAQENGAA